LFAESEKIDVTNWDYVTEYAGWMVMLLLSEYIAGDFKLYLASKCMSLKHLFTLTQICIRYNRKDGEKELANMVTKMLPNKIVKNYGEKISEYLIKMVNICNNNIYKYIHASNCLYRSKDDSMRMLCSFDYIPKRINFWRGQSIFYRNACHL